jgi:hypothetical protein
MTGAVDVKGSAARHADEIGLTRSKSWLMLPARGVRRRAHFRPEDDSYRTSDVVAAVIHDSVNAPSFVVAKHMSA